MIDIFNNNESINSQRNCIVRLLRESKIFESLNKLNTFVQQANDITLNAEFDRIYNSYRYLLEYYTRGFNDPDRQNQLDIIVNNIYLLTDRTAFQLLAKKSSKLFYLRYNNSISDLQAEIEQYNNLTEGIRFAENNPDADFQANKTTLYANRESVEKNIFHYIWTRFPLNTNDTTLISELLSGKTPDYFKCLVIGALFLSLLYYYDEAKLNLLIEAYSKYSQQTDSESVQISSRAMVCLVITLYRHNKRSAISKPLSQRMNLLSEQGNFQSDIENTFINLVRAKNAETLSKSIQDSIIPDIMKIAPDIIERAKKNNGVIDITSLEENPDWQEVFNKTGLSKKIEEFSKMQTNGDDVFLSTFLHLKNYPFFKELYNWFRPYHTDNSAIAKALSTMKPSVGTLINGATYLCDNDKYSFVLSLCELNESQREMMLQQFDARGSELEESISELNILKQREDAINLFIKDIYRFFSIFSRRTEFANIFNSKLALQECACFAEHLNSASLINTIAEIYFKTKDYHTAIEYFQILNNMNETVNPVYQQKMGFAYQSIGEFEKAINHYQHYSLTNETDVWNLKHIAACYRAIGKYAEATSYLIQALEIKPSDTSISLTLGHCYTETGEFDKALKEYYKVEYLDTKKHSARRPLAWCLFLTRDFEKSRKYYTLIFNEDSPNDSDYLNFGHLCLAEKKFDEAVSYYYNVFSSLSNDFEAFAEKWRADIPHLIQAGLSPSETELLLDSILISFKK